MNMGRFPIMKAIHEKTMTGVVINFMVPILYCENHFLVQHGTAFQDGDLEIAHGDGEGVDGGNIGQRTEKPAGGPGGGQ